MIEWLLHTALSLVPVTGKATTFSAHHDPWNPNPRLACIRRNLDDRHDMVAAHRTLPCGAKLVVCVPRTGRCAHAAILERGPFGRKTRHPSQYRAELDLAPALRRALKHNGYEPVIFWRVK